MRTPVTFEVGFFSITKAETYITHRLFSKDCCLSEWIYLIQVCHSSRIVTPVCTLLATQSRPERVATSCGLYTFHQLAESVELSSIVTSSLSNPSSSNMTPTQAPTASNISQVVWGT